MLVFFAGVDSAAAGAAWIAAVDALWGEGILVGAADPDLLRNQTLDEVQELLETAPENWRIERLRRGGGKSKGWVNVIGVSAMSKRAPSEERLSVLWDAVPILALPASEQLAILEAAGDSRGVDELALDYNDNCWVINGAVSRNELTQDELSALRSLDRQLDQMSGEANSGNWTTKALRSYGCWESVRRLAATALAMRQIAKVKKSAA